MIKPITESEVGQAVLGVSDGKAMAEKA